MYSCMGCTAMDTNSTTGVIVSCVHAYCTHPKSVSCVGVIRGICSVGLLHGSVPWVCSMGLLHGSVPCMGLFHGSVPCTGLFHAHGSVPWICFMGLCAPGLSSPDGAEHAPTHVPPHLILTCIESKCTAPGAH